MGAALVLPTPVAPTDIGAFVAALDAAAAYQRAETAGGTRRAYASDYRHFAAWCSRSGTIPVPAAIETVAAYLAHLAGSGLRVSTIDRRAAAIAYAHRRAGHDTPTHAEPVRAVLRGIRRTHGAAVDRKRPATADALKAMLRKLPRSLIGTRDRALLLIGFAAALRRSELVALDVEDLELHDEGIVVRIRRSKTDQEGRGHAVAVPRGSRLRPCEALQDWLAAAGIAEGAVFRRVGKGGRIGGRLTDQSVALIVKGRARAAGLDAAAFSGHSLRAGFVTSALEHGADLLRVMDVTRHREVRTLQAYDRRLKAFRNHAGKGFL